LEVEAAFQLNPYEIISDIITNHAGFTNHHISAPQPQSNINVIFCLPGYTEAF